MIRAQVWDTCGQEKYRSIMKSYYRGAVAALLVFDLTNQDSFNHVDTWLKEIKENTSDLVVIALVGNKADLTNIRIVRYEDV
jgi:small GTP-binding protein